MKKLSKEQPASSVARPIVVESVVDPFDGLDEILGNYANTRKQITEDKSTWKQMLVHVGTSSTTNDFSFGKFKEVEVEANTESEEEESDTEGNDTSGSDLEDLDYDPKHDDVFTADPKHDTSIGVVDVQEDDLDVIDYDSFSSDLDDGIDSERRIQLRELIRICKQKKQGRQLILVKNDNEMVRVRCEGTILALAPYVAIDNNMGKNVFTQTKGGLVIRENINSGKQNMLGKDKTVKGKGKKVITPKKVDKYSCPWTMLVIYTKECKWEVRTLIEDHTCIQSRAIKACTSRFLADHVIKSLATNPDILVRAVQDQMQKQFEELSNKVLELVVEKSLIIAVEEICKDNRAPNINHHFIVNNIRERVTNKHLKDEFPYATDVQVAVDVSTAKSLGYADVWFLGCPQIDGQRCIYFGWVDPPICQRAMLIIPGLLRARNRMEADMMVLVQANRNLKKYLILSWLTFTLFLLLS
ncbi:hypothetical protein Tco_0648795 [Tanacetum coccineum]